MIHEYFDKKVMELELNLIDKIHYYLTSSLIKHFSIFIYFYSRYNFKLSLESKVFCFMIVLI